MTEFLSIWLVYVLILISSLSPQLQLQVELCVLVVLSIEMVFKSIQFTSKLILVQHRLLRTPKVALSSNRKLTSQVKHSMMEKLIAIGQMRATNDKAANRQQVQQIVDSAAEKNACVCIPMSMMFHSVFILNSVFLPVCVSSGVL